MKMRIINNTTASECGLTPAEFVANYFFKHLKDNQVLVCVINNEKTEGGHYLVGIATKDERGYDATNIVLDEPKYDIACKWVEEANVLVTGKNLEEQMKIIFSSMFKK
jgi:hypothetical protein